MQLLYIIGTYPLVTTTFIEREVRMLRSLGASIRIVSLRRPPPEHPQPAEEITYLLPPGLLKLVAAHLHFGMLHPRVYFTLLLELVTQPRQDFRQRFKTLMHFGEGVYTAYIVRDTGFEHIHAHFIDRAALVALCVSRLLKIPYSVTAHANDIYKAPLLVPAKLANARFVVTVSEFNKEYLVNKFEPVDRRKVIVLHPWVDLEEFPLARPHPANDHFTIVSVGRLVPKKGHSTLIEACGLLHQQGMNFECRIIGDGPQRVQLEQQIAALDLQDHVTLLGSQPKDRVLANLQSADVFALPATIAPDGDRDGMPVALAEAMAVGIPVISTNIVGIRELVRVGTGFLVPSDDAQALAGALQRVQAMPVAERRAMGVRAREIVAREFELESGVRQLAALFHSSANDPDARTAKGILYRPRRRTRSDTVHRLGRRVRNIF